MPTFEINDQEFFDAITDVLDIGEIVERVEREIDRSAIAEDVEDHLDYARIAREVEEGLDYVDIAKYVRDELDIEGIVEAKINDCAVEMQRRVDRIEGLLKAVATILSVLNRPEPPF